MTLENIYYIGQTLAVIVIIATLIALLIQTRQTNALARAETSRATMLQLTSGQYSLIAFLKRLKKRRSYTRPCGHRKN